MAVRVTTKFFGKYSDGRDVTLYTMENESGMSVAVTDLGAAIVKVLVPDGKQGRTDVVLGFDRAEDYLRNPSFFGVVIGPSANRIGNASFCIDGVTCHVDVNDNQNNLHSHKEKGYHKQLWSAAVGQEGVTFSLEDTDGNLGFPGNKRISVEYCVGEDNSLRIHYHGSSDKQTILNLTNHTYFNLDGHDSGNTEQHELWLNASRYTPADAGSIPTGEIAKVAGTPMDFTKPERIGARIGDDFEQLRFAGGYDHNWVIDGWKDDGELRHFATATAPESGRVLKAYTTLPGVQFYAGNFIDRQTGKNEAIYEPRGGFCLETQYFPDSVNKPNFPSCVFGGDREYDSVTVYRFE